MITQSGGAGARLRDTQRETHTVRESFHTWRNGKESEPQCGAEIRGIKWLYEAERGIWSYRLGHCVYMRHSVSE